MRRRLFLAAALALAVAPAASAQSTPAPGRKTVEVGKVFPYFDRYLRLPAAERDRFSMAYYWSRDGKPLTGPVAVLVDGPNRVPITAGPNGRVERLPTLAQIAAKRPLTFEGLPAATKLNLSLSIEPTLRPAAELPAPELAAAVAQASRGAKKAAGMMRLAMPKLDAVRLVGAQGAEVVTADGRALPLPVEKGVPVFRPSQHPNAQLVRSRTPPRQLQIGS